VELVTDGALDHLDALTRSYTRHPRYYGHIYPVAQRWRETRVICRIHARRVTLDAIHACAATQPGDHQQAAQRADRPGGSAAGGATDEDTTVG
jgi:hypothetical protein